jgi:hypothetical protein
VLTTNSFSVSCALVHSYANVLQEHRYPRHTIMIWRRHQHRHRLCCPAALTWTGSPRAASILRAKGLSKPRNKEQLIMISRVGAILGSTLLWPPCLCTSVEALPISTLFSRSAVQLVPASVDGGSSASASTPPPPATNSGRPVTNIDPGSAAADSFAFQC